MALTFFINDAKPLGPSTCRTVLHVSSGVSTTLQTPAKRLATQVVKVMETCSPVTRDEVGRRPEVRGTLKNGLA